MVSFHFLIATVGRPTLNRQLEAIKKQVTAEDCITIVFDGCTRRNCEALDTFPCKVIVFEEPVALGHWGHGIRNKYASILEPRDFILHGDDDDIYADGMLDILRYTCIDSSCLYIAQMLFNGQRIPMRPEICYCNIGTPCGIIPYELNKKGTWDYFHGGDAKFYKSLEATGVRVEYLPHVIYIVRP
jgi:hypothetical protein